VVRVFWLFLAFVGLVSECWSQPNSTTGKPFTTVWKEGKCIGCKVARELGRIQFASRDEGWAVGCSFPPPGAQGSGDFNIVHTDDGGGTWREVPQVEQYAGDADGPPAFSVLDARRVMVAWWNPAEEPRFIGTRDGGKRWQQISNELLQKIQFFDERHGYGAETSKFLRTEDGGSKWNRMEMRGLRFIDRMYFLTRDVGWIAGASDGGFIVYRTTNGGREWTESRTLVTDEMANVRDLFFVDDRRGWLITWHYGNGGTYLFSTVDGGRTWRPEPDHSFQGQAQWAASVRFIGDAGFVFVNREESSYLMHTRDGGVHWSRVALKHRVYDCQVLGGNVLCSAGTWPSGFRLLTIRPR
jgi:photosystem II stability/assembly factor-like uncharacterized protein